MLLRKFLSRSPVAARVTPFIVIVLITALRGKFGPESTYWLYPVEMLAGLWLILEIYPLVPEMRWAISWEAVVVGVAIFAVWVGVSGEWTTQSSLWVKLGLTHPSKELMPEWNPEMHFSRPLASFFIVVRILGSTWIVPPIEEVFYRSFLYRYIANQSFLDVPLNRFLPVPFLATAALFGFSHNEWLAGIICGAAYQWLVLRKNRLGDAMTAHAITNFLLGVWVVWRGAWNFW